MRRPLVIHTLPDRRILYRLLSDPAWTDSIYDEGIDPMQLREYLPCQISFCPFVRSAVA